MLAGCHVTVRGQRRPLVKTHKVGGELETVVEHREDERKTGADRRESKSTVFEERARVKTSGDVYHPDLLNYDVMVGTGLAEQNVHSDDVSGWSTGTLDEYLVSVQALRAKPYSGTL